MPLVALTLLLAASPQEAARIERLRDLPDSGTSWYVYRSRGERQGYIRVRASRARHEAKEALQIDFELNLKLRRGPARMQTTTLSRLDAWLTPVRIESHMEAGGRTETRTATFEDGKARIGDREREFTAPLLTSETEVLLVRAMSHKKGTKLAYSSWETEDMRAKSEHFLEVVGTEAVDVDGKRVECTKIRHSGKGCREHFYWVDSDRRVVRMLFDNRKEMTLTTEEKAVGEK